jgi:hypothetical protein
MRSRFVETPGLSERATKGGMRDGRRGRETRSLRQVGDRFGTLPPLMQQDPELLMRVGQLRIDPDRLP